MTKLLTLAVATLSLYKAIGAAFNVSATLFKWLNTLTNHNSATKRALVESGENSLEDWVPLLSSSLSDELLNDPSQGVVEVSNVSATLNTVSEEYQKVIDGLSLVESDATDVMSRMLTKLEQGSKILTLSNENNENDYSKITAWIIEMLEKFDDLAGIPNLSKPEGFDDFIKTNCDYFNALNQLEDILPIEAALAAVEGSTLPLITILMSASDLMNSISISERDLMTEGHRIAFTEFCYSRDTLKNQFVTHGTQTLYDLKTGSCYRFDQTALSSDVNNLVDVYKFPSMKQSIKSYGLNLGNNSRLYEPEYLNVLGDKWNSNSNSLFIASRRQHLPL